MLAQYKTDSGPFRRIFPMPSVFLPALGLEILIQSSLITSYGRKSMIPALLSVSDSSFNVALFGSTPREREKSFVAISILRCGVRVLGRFFHKNRESSQL